MSAYRMYLFAGLAILTQIAAGTSIVVVMLFSTGAHAESWKLYGATDQFKAFVDMDSIRQDGRYARAWTRLDYSSLQKTPSGNAYYISELQSKAVDCGNRATALTSYVSKDRNGVIVDSSTFQS